MTLKVGTIHHQLKYKDEESEAQKDRTLNREETPILMQRRNSISSTFSQVQIPLEIFLMQVILVSYQYVAI